MLDWHILQIGRVCPSFLFFFETTEPKQNCKTTSAKYESNAVASHEIKGTTMLAGLQSYKVKILSGITYRMRCNITVAAMLQFRLPVKTRLKTHCAREWLHAYFCHAKIHLAIHTNLSSSSQFNELTRFQALAMHWRFLHWLLHKI